MLALNLDRFKVEFCGQLCGRRDCSLAHSPQELRRRLSAVGYRKELCGGEGCRGGACGFAHNAFEVRFHIENYRKKLCQEFLAGTCTDGVFCDSVHSFEEAKFRPLHLMPIDRNFLFFHFKSEFCPYSWVTHHAFSCVYAHNWQDFKRPFNSSLKPISCPNWDKSSKLTEYEQGCPEGFNCVFCHGWKELEYHPAVFKTVNCKKCIREPSQAREDLSDILRHNCSFKHPNELPESGFNKKYFHLSKRNDGYLFHSTNEFLAEIGLSDLSLPRLASPAPACVREFLKLRSSKHHAYEPSLRSLISSKHHSDSTSLRISNQEPEPDERKGYQSRPQRFGSMRVLALPAKHRPPQSIRQLPPQTQRKKSPQQLEVPRFYRFSQLSESSHGSGILPARFNEQEAVEEDRQSLPLDKKYQNSELEYPKRFEPSDF